LIFGLTVGDVNMRDGDLAQRVAWLEAIEEIRRLKARYCAYCDDNYDPEGIASLFVKDGVWDGERFGRHVGRDQIKAFFKSVSGEIVFAAHLALNPIIEVKDTDHAAGRWRLIMPATVRTDGRNEARWLVAAYTDAYVKLDGVWLFESMHTHVNFFEPHDGSWASSAVP
jgi:uncharacterized protein (TIGR02246 family)